MQRLFSDIVGIFELYDRVFRMIYDPIWNFFFYSLSKDMLGTILEIALLGYAGWLLYQKKLKKIFAAKPAGDASKPEAEGKKVNKERIFMGILTGIVIILLLSMRYGM